MAEFTINIDDPLHLAAITWAREQYNASLLPQIEPLPPRPQPDPNNPAPSDTEKYLVEPEWNRPLPLESDAAYLQYVVQQAVADYVRQMSHAELP